MAVRLAEDAGIEKRKRRENRMQALKDLEIGGDVLGRRRPCRDTARSERLGVRCGQIGVPGDMDLGVKAREAWKSALAAEQFTLVTVFAAYNARATPISPRCRRRSGFIPPATPRRNGKSAR